jgi:hypothetical protein
VITQDKNHIPWNKYHIPPLRKPRGFSCQSYRSCKRLLQCWEYDTRGWINLGDYENVFTQEYHVSRRQHPMGISYSWVNKFSYFLNPHAINVLLYRMKPRKHIHVKYCWQKIQFDSILDVIYIYNNVYLLIILVLHDWSYKFAYYCLLTQK